jgi:inner membrane transporter RhtA
MVSARSRDATALETVMALARRFRTMTRDAGWLRLPANSDRAVAVGMVLVAAVSPQIGAAFAVTLFSELGPAGAAFLRLAFAAIVLWAIWRPRLTGDLRLAGAFGVALGLMNWSFYAAIDRIPLGVAVTIEFAGPLLVAVIGSRRPLDLVWVVLAAAGIVLLVDPAGGSLDPTGVAFALAAAVCWMAYIYLSKRTGAAFSGGSGLAIAMAVGALIVLPAGVLQAGDALTDPGLLGAAFVVAILSSVLPYSLDLEALRRLPAAVFGVLMSLDPAVAAVVGFVVLGQALGVREAFAIAMVVVASAGAASLSHRTA